MMAPCPTCGEQQSYRLCLDSYHDGWDPAKYLRELLERLKYPPFGR